MKKGVIGCFAAVVGLSMMASAEVLISEGCDTASDYAGVSADGSGLLGNFPRTWNASVGLANGKWTGYGSQPRAWARTLPLPEGFESKGAACVGMNRGSNATDHRWAYLGVGDTLKVAAGTTLYFRGLISVDNGAATMLSKASDNTIGNNNSFGFCLVPRPDSFGGGGGSPIGLANNIGFYYWKNSTGNQSVSVRVTDAAAASQSKRLIDGITTPTTVEPNAGNTYICYAEIKVGAGTDGKEVVRAGASLVSEYDPAGLTWCDPIEAEIISDTAYPRHLAIVGDYCVNGWAVMDEFIVGTELSDVLVAAVAGSCKLTDATLSGSAGSYTAGASVSLAAATDAGVVAHDGSGTGVTLSVGAVALDGDDPVPFTKAFSNDDLAADKTYEVYVYAENDVSMVSNAVGTVYTGALTLTKVQDAAEKDAVVGQVTVSRASADSYPLTVNYTLTSACEAAAEGRTWVAPTPVVIPANETSATLTLTPKNDMSVDEDISVTLALADGNYEIAAEPIVLTLVNNSVPRDANVWVAGADGLASVAGNWSYGHAPRTDESVLFDGDYSTASCTWDADAEGGPSATIASLKVASTYTKTITILTTFPEVAGSSFHTLTVTGDALLNGGTLTHAKHTSDHRRDYYRLALSVGRNLTVGSAAKISADEKGSYLAVSGLASTYGGSYSGGGRAWGSLTEPTNVGSSGHAQNAVALAGGALWLEVAGAATVDGNISANGVKGSSGDAYAGSGGSVYLKAATLSGTGSVSANCQMTDRSSNTKSGAGGRVSILLTEGELTDFPMANVTAYAACASYANVGGAGTVLVRTPQKPNGILYLKDRTDKFGTYGYRPSVAQLTDMPQGATWTLDGIVFGPNAILRVRTDNVLELVNGLESVSNPTSTERENGILLDNGATLRLPSSATHTISTPWLFQANGGFTLNGNLVLANGGSVGTHNLYITNTNSTPRCEMRVTGDMTVAEGSYIWAQGGGYFGNGIDTVPFGKNIRGSHGGQNAADSSCVCYDSFFNPRMPGGFGDSSNYFPVGGGAVILTVDGELALNGRATASPKASGVKGRPGAAGTINLTVGALTGTGSIDANGQKYDSQWDQGTFKGASGGGRVAVKLTRKGAAFDEHWLSHITAKGASPTYVSTGSGVTLKTEYASSAGSVYLQNAAQGEGAGLISVFNDGDSSNTKAYTALPARAFGGEDDVFSKASLSIGSCAQVRLMETLKMQDLRLAANTALDLNGKKLTVAKAVLGPTKLNSGTYTAAQIAKVAGEGYVSGEGTLEVTGGGIAVIIR